MSYSEVNNKFDDILLPIMILTITLSSIGNAKFCVACGLSSEWLHVLIELLSSLKYRNVSWGFGLFHGLAIADILALLPRCDL